MCVRRSERARLCGMWCDTSNKHTHTHTHTHSVHLCSSRYCTYPAFFQNINISALCLFTRIVINHLCIWTKPLYRVSDSDWPLSSMVPKEEPCLPQQNHLHAWQCTISRCKEYLCVIGCYGHNMRNSWCGHHPSLTSTLLRTFGASSSERSMRVEGS